MYNCTQPYTLQNTLTCHIKRKNAQWDMQEEWISQAAVNSLKKVTRTPHTKQQRNPPMPQHLPQSSAWFGNTHSYWVHYASVLLPFHRDACANEQPKVPCQQPSHGQHGSQGGGFGFIAAALPRHRDNSKQLSDAGVEACNRDKK